MKRCIGFVVWAAVLLPPVVLAQETHQATGVKVGEVTPDSAVVWMRLTQHAARNADGEDPKGVPGRELQEQLLREGYPGGFRVDTLKRACPGMEGRVRLRYGLRDDLGDAQATPWVDVTAETVSPLGARARHDLLLRSRDGRPRWHAGPRGPAGPVHDGAPA